MFLSLFCKITLLTAFFIVTQSFEYPEMPNNYEAVSMWGDNREIDNRMPRKTRIERHWPKRGKNGGNEVPTAGPFNDPNLIPSYPYSTPPTHTDSNEINSQNDNRKPKREMALLALYPNVVDRMVKKRRAYPQQNEYFLD